MQKKLIALAIASAFSVPAFADTANVTVYGTAHVSLDANSGNAPATAAVGTKDGLNLTSSSSNLGFKGAEEVGSLKVVYQWETEVFAQGNAATMFSAQRDSYVGVAGGFGTVVAGRLPLANQYANDANFFGAKVGDNGNMTAGGFGGLGLMAVPSRVSRALGYVSPSFGGATVTVGFVPNTQQSISGTQNGVEKSSSLTLRVAYENAGIFAAVNMLNINATGIALGGAANVIGTVGQPGTGTFAQSGAKITLLSIAGGYDFGIAKVRAQVVSTDANSQAGFSAGATHTAGSSVKQRVITVGGQFNLSDSDSIKAQVTKASDATGVVAAAANNGGTMMVVGYDHNMSKRTTVYAAYAKVSNGVAGQFSATGYAHGGVGTPGAGFDPSALSVGIIHKF